MFGLRISVRRYSARAKGVGHERVRGTGMAGHRLWVSVLGTCYVVTVTK